jgi:hypothetical protein
VGGGEGPIKLEWPPPLAQRAVARPSPSHTSSRATRLQSPTKTGPTKSPGVVTRRNERFGGRFGSMGAKPVPGRRRSGRSTRTCLLSTGATRSPPATTPPGGTTSKTMWTSQRQAQDASQHAVVARETGSSYSRMRSTIKKPVSLYNPVGAKLLQRAVVRCHTRCYILRRVLTKLGAIEQAPAGGISLTSFTRGPWLCLPPNDNTSFSVALCELQPARRACLGEAPCGSARPELRDGRSRARARVQAVIQSVSVRSDDHRAAR